MSSDRTDRRADPLLRGSYMLFGGAGNEESHDDFESAADEMIALTGKAAPNFLFIGYAQLEPHHGFEYYGDVFMRRGCASSYLDGTDAADPASAKEKIGRADLIFIIGGSTAKLMDTLDRGGISPILRDAAGRGCVMTGLSAGAIALCLAGASKNEDYCTQTGAGCLPLYFCPHSLTSPRRLAFFKEEIKKTPAGVGIALDGAALEISGGRYRAFVHNRGGYLAKVFREKGGRLSENDLAPEWSQIEELIR